MVVDFALTSNNCSTLFTSILHPQQDPTTWNGIGK